VYWIAPSPVRAHVIWAGTDDGLIWLTRDEGAHWQNVTPPGLTPWSKVGIIDASHFNASTAYAAIDRHRLDDDHPYIYKTHDGGKHWMRTVSGIPADESVNVVREDPKRAGLLYAGTERHVYVSFNDGASWQPLQQNLPVASMRDIVFNGEDVILATHGRGIWILDDAKALREAGASLTRLPAKLFTPDVAYRTRSGNDQGTPIPFDETQLPNPPSGAILDYYVGTARGTLTLQILDASGHLVRQWASTDQPISTNPKNVDIPAYWLQTQYPPSNASGAHRWIWDLHYAGTGPVRRRGGGGPLAPPGRYTVRLSIAGKTYTQPLTVKRDPNYHATDADLRAQFALAQAIEAQIASVKSARERAQALVKARGSKMSAAERRRLETAIGSAPSPTPDDSIGHPAQDFNSLRYTWDALENLKNAVESADARPTSDMYATFTILKSKASRAMQMVNGARTH
jgi:hypothetical protein